MKIERKSSRGIVGYGVYQWKKQNAFLNNKAKIINYLLKYTLEIIRLFICHF